MNVVGTSALPTLLTTPTAYEFNSGVYEQSFRIGTKHFNYYIESRDRGAIYTIFVRKIDVCKQLCSYNSNFSFLRCTGVGLFTEDKFPRTW